MSVKIWDSTIGGWKQISNGANGTDPITIQNNANDRLITGTYTTGMVEAESDATFGGDILKIRGGISAGVPVSDVNGSGNFKQNPSYDERGTIHRYNSPINSNGPEIFLSNAKKNISGGDYDLEVGWTTCYFNNSGSIIEIELDVNVIAVLGGTGVHCTRVGNRDNSYPDVIKIAPNGLATIVLVHERPDSWNTYTQYVVSGSGVYV